MIVELLVRRARRRVGRRSVRIAAATISALPLGTTASTLRMKWTRQRCQAAPMQDRADRGLQAGVGVGDDQLHPVEAAGLQRAQERGPERPVLAVADVEAQHLAAAVGGDPGGDHDRLGHHPVVRPGPCSRWRRGTRTGRSMSARDRSRNAATSSSRSAQIRDTSDLEIPVSAPSALTRSSTLRVRDPVQVGLHHHREQRLVDPAAPLQQRREERPGPQLRDPQLQIPRGRGQRPRPGAVALRGALDRCAPTGPAPITAVRFGVDQRLVQRLGRDPDPVIDIGGLQCLRAARAGQTGPWPSCVVSFREFFDRYSLTVARWPPTSTTPTPRPGTTPPQGTSPVLAGAWSLMTLRPGPCVSGMAAHSDPLV